MPRLGTVVYLKPSNIILIVRPENLKSEKAFGARHGLRGEQANVIFEHDPKNHGEISPREVLHSGKYYPIRVYIYRMSHLGHGKHVCRRGENYSGNLFALSFLGKNKNCLTHCRSSK